ncbi:MAG: hypothetical protein EAX96_05130 [Candidatus Lokiarchaeota archaeon]|nr:hypothetical protein [Candidatus Lokiarchaeota archaeon]
MDSNKIVRLVLGIVTIFYSFLGIWYFTQIIDYYGAFIAVGFLILGGMMIFSGIIQKSPQIDPTEEPCVDFDEWVIIAWAGVVALGIYYLILPVYLSILYAVVFFLYYAIISTSTYLIERVRINRKYKPKKIKQIKPEKEMEKSKAESENTKINVDKKEGKESKPNKMV